MIQENVQKKIVGLQYYLNNLQSLKEFKEQGTLEIRIEKSLFESFIYPEENPVEACQSLCNSIEEKFYPIDDSNLKYLAKPLFNAILMSYFYWKYTNGGINFVLQESKAEYYNEILEAFQEIGLTKQAEIFKSVLNIYYEDMKELNGGQLMDLMEYFDKYEYLVIEPSSDDAIFNYDQTDEIINKTDKYLLANIDTFCI